MKEFFLPEEEKAPELEEEYWRQIIERKVLTAKEKLEIPFSEEETSRVIQKIEKIITKIRYGIIPLNELETPSNLQPNVGDIFIFLNFCQKYNSFYPDIKIFFGKVVAKQPGIRLRNILLAEKNRKEIVPSQNEEITDFFLNPRYLSLIPLKSEKLCEN